MSIKGKDLLHGAETAFGGFLAILLILTSKKNTMPGIEHGSAKWGTASDISHYKDSTYQNNILFTKTEWMSLNTRKTMRNNNVLVIGGSGSGKTRFYVKPNLMQLHSSYVVTDPKGTLILETGKMFADNGYKIKVLNLIDFNKSMKYNPFAYIHSEKDILKLADLIIKNCGDKNEKEDFWVKAERLLYQALIGLVYYEYPVENRNFGKVLELINMMEVRENDETFKNKVDLIFELLEKENPNHYAVLQYKKFKLSAGKTAKSILVSCGVRLAAFDINEVKDLTSKDEMNLMEIGEEKTILYIIIDDTSATFNFLAGMLYTQLFNTLCNHADNDCNGSLKVHVRCILDEFANIGQIPDFEKLIATIRSRNISANVILQNMSQLKSLYDKQAGTIVGNCDSLLFLGSGEEETMKMISEKVGKTTIDHRSSSESKGQNGSYTLSNQIIGRELITPAEVGLMDNSECMLFIRGVRPFKSKKIDITKHDNYEQLSDSDKENLFDIVAYKRHQEKEQKNIDRYFDTDEMEIL